MSKNIQYNYWVSGIVDNSKLRIEVAFKYTSNNEFNSKSIDECTKLFIENAHSFNPAFDDSSNVIIKFFGKLAD